MTETKSNAEILDIESWLGDFLPRLRRQFGQRLWFVGLQGSYARGEAKPGSDIDVVVILEEELTAADIGAYGQLLAEMPARELICGFFSGRRELLAWEPAELLQFYYDTIPLLGSLDALLPLIDGAAVERAVQDGAGAVYHACVHNMLHEQDGELLRGLYKAAAFVAQAVYFRTHGRFIRQQQELAALAGPAEAAIMETCLALRAGAAVDFWPMSAALFEWAQGLLVK